MSNPLDLDFTPWKPRELREFRESLWISVDELRAKPNYVRSCPSSSDMASRVGVYSDQWRTWELHGVPSIGWSALLRIYRDEERDVSPMNCSLTALAAVADLLGNYSELARALEVDRRTITKWLYSYGYVPGKLGYGRIVRICYEDLVLC